jgi:hypothetical protein
MIEDFSIYEQMRTNGSSPQEVYLTAKSDGHNFMVCIRLLRRVFDLSVFEAKEVIVIGNEWGTSRNEYQGKIEDILEKYFEEHPDEDI